MNKWWGYPGQILVLTLFVAFIGYFSAAPTHTHLLPGQAVIKLSFSHSAQLKGKCRQRTEEELAGLPRNMRQVLVCPRERSPTDIEITLNNKTILQQRLSPSGLRKDGPASLYRRLHVKAGQYQIQAKLRDSIHVQGFNYAGKIVVALKPAQILIIDFNPERGGFIFRRLKNKGSPKRNVSRISTADPG